MAVSSASTRSFPQLKAAHVALKILAAAGLFVVFCGAGCGSSSPTAPSPYTQTMTGTVSTFGVTRHALTIPRSGNMTLALTWGNSAVDLDLYLTPSTCTELTTSCTIFARSDSFVGTSESISRTVTNGETYNIFVDSNDQTQSQSYTLDLRIQ